MNDKKNVNPQHEADKEELIRFYDSLTADKKVKFMKMMRSLQKALKQKTSK